MSKPRGNARTLFEAGIDSLLLSIEIYNRPSDTGRSHSVVMLLQHGLEMILKSAIKSRRGRIRDPGSKYNYGFKKCVNIAETDLGLLTSDEATQLRTLENHRDAATHDVLTVPEDLLYFTVHGGIHVAVRLVRRAFDYDLLEAFPSRALPIAAEVPPDLPSVIQANVEHARRLLAPGRRKGQAARSIIRSLANVEAALSGDHDGPSDQAVRGMAEKLKVGAAVDEVFPNVANVVLAQPEDAGTAIFVTVTVAKDGLPVRFAEAGEDAAGIKQVNDFEIYKFSSVRLGQKVGITGPKARALADYLDMRGNLTYHKMVRQADGGLHSRFSDAAVALMRDQIDKVDIDAVWSDYYRGGGR